MDASHQSKIIEKNPIGNGLDAFRASFNSACKPAAVSGIQDAVEHLSQEDLRNLALDLIHALQGLRASRHLPSSGRDRYLAGDLSKLLSAVISEMFDLDRIKPLLRSVIAGEDDALIWGQVYRAAPLAAAG